MGGPEGRSGTMIYFYPLPTTSQQVWRRLAFMDIGPTIRRLVKYAADCAEASVKDINEAFTPDHVVDLTNSDPTEVKAAWEAAVDDSGTPTLMLVA